jgi:hypothetical protein
VRRRQFGATAREFLKVLFPPVRCGACAPLAGLLVDAVDVPVQGLTPKLASLAHHRDCSTHLTIFLSLFLAHCSHRLDAVRVGSLLVCNTLVYDEYSD